jgi:hypothetical protein
MGFNEIEKTMGKETFGRLNFQTSFAPSTQMSGALDVEQRGWAGCKQTNEFPHTSANFMGVSGK